MSKPARASSRTLAALIPRRASHETIKLQALGPDDLAKPWIDPVVIPIRDNRFSPALRRGQFAVVDTRLAYPDFGVIMWLQFKSSGNFAFAALSNKHAGLPAPPGCLKINYGWIEARTLDGRQDTEFAGVVSGDWIPETYLKQIIVGQVIGVLGASDLAL